MTLDKKKLIKYSYLMHRFFMICVLSMIIIAPSISILAWNKNSDSLDFFVLLTVAAVFATGYISAIFFAQRGVSYYTFPIKSSIAQFGTRQFLKVLFISIILTLVCNASYTASYILNTKDFSRLSTTFLQKVVDNPGGLFATLTGVATLVGLYYTWKGLSEIRSTINNFPELIERLCSLTNEANPRNRLKIMAYTPAIGAITQPDYWLDFKQVLIEKINQQKNSVELVCLDSSQLEIWHSLFEGKKGVSVLGIDVANNAAREVIDAITGAKKNGADVESNLREPMGYFRALSWKMLPGYYFFLTNKKAIIVTPLFLPFQKGIPRKKEEGEKGPVLVENENNPAVQMIGMATQDRAIINDLHELFESYKKVPDTALAAADIKVKFTVMKSWTNSDSAKTELEEITSQISSSLRESIKSSGYYEAEEYNDEDEISIAVRASHK